jgi:hypothetical protein
MQPPRALLQPLARHGGRVIGKNGRVGHLALLQAHAFSIFEVNGWNDQHGGEDSGSLLVKYSGERA